MKVEEILEMSDEDIVGDTGEKPVLSDKMQKRKAADLAKAKAERDWGRGRRGSRLTGRGRGTGGADRSMTQR